MAAVGSYALVNCGTNSFSNTAAVNSIVGLGYKRSGCLLTRPYIPRKLCYILNRVTTLDTRSSFGESMPQTNWPGDDKDVNAASGWSLARGFHSTARASSAL
ncbi:hypothetical protein K440DRAFT_613373 [Wilcoxina mikolae CBS 423.85]|nr:hypothetical protein K440DRAFT_613373 [Wilcoxina mikolae CBS 423.85]